MLNLIFTAQIIATQISGVSLPHEGLEGPALLSFLVRYALGICITTAMGLLPCTSHLHV